MNSDILKKKICISIDPTLPYKWHYDVYAGIVAYLKGRPDYEYRHNMNFHLKSNRSEESYDGVVGRLSREMVEYAENVGISMVNVYHNLDLPKVPSVLSNVGMHAELSFKHLYARGVRYFVGLSCLGDSVTEEYFSKLDELASEHNCQSINIPFDKSKFHDYDYIVGLVDNLKLIKDKGGHALGVSCYYSPLARMFVNHFLERGIKIPEDVLVITSGTDEAICNMEPKLSCIQRCEYEQGYKAAEMLCRFIDGKKVEDKHVKIEPASVLSRCTTNTYNIEDEHVKKAMLFMNANSNKTIVVPSN